MKHTTGTLLCSDVFTEGGTDHPALFEGDILGPSDAFRRKLDFYNHTKDTRAMLTRLEGLKPRRWLACMVAPGAATAQGFSWRWPRPSKPALRRAITISLRKDEPRPPSVGKVGFACQTERQCSKGGIKSCSRLEG
jgi:hypothetical protein